MRRYLVTGAQGFLGRRIVDFLNSRGAQVLSTGRRPEKGVYVCDLNDTKEVKNLISWAAPDCIIHCAASVPKKTDEYNAKTIYFKNLNILDVILRESNCSIVYISSMTVYGSDLRMPVSENDACNPESEYGRSKLAGERMIIDSGRSGFAARIPGLFGLPRRGGLVYNILSALKYKKKLNLPNDYLQWAGMHVKHAALSVSKLSTIETKNFEAINIGYEGKQSINLLLDILNQQYNNFIQYDIVQPFFEFNLKKATKYGVVPNVDIKDALIQFGNEI